MENRKIKLNKRFLIRRSPFSIVLVLFVAFFFSTLHADEVKDTPEKKGGRMTTVRIETSMGVIVAELDGEKAPETVQNFLSYVNSRFYDGTIFHRVIDGFMIQGGGFTPDMEVKETESPIKNEAGNGLKNLRGTLAMARTNVVDSATSQFFINLVDNGFLDHKNRTPQGFGYAVFGRVVEGMDVVDAIGSVQTGNVKGHGDVPLETVVMEKAAVVE
jgi:cyclophilin family peptidyl-prolyl cis-trans isomerase